MFRPHAMQQFEKSQAKAYRPHSVYGLLWVLLMLLIVVFYVLIRQHLLRQVEQAAAERMRTQVMVLQEHAMRTLDTLQARVTRLMLVQSQTGLPRPAHLHDMIRDIPVVRGISLVDGQGRVVSSSDERRLGQVLRLDVMNLVQMGARADVLSLSQLADAEPFEPPVPLASLDDRVLWLAGPPLSIGGRDQRWVMALDIEMLRRLWTTVGQHTGALIGLFGPAGQPWVLIHFEN